MTEIERLTEVREMLAEARRHVGQDVFVGLAVEPISLLARCDSACADSLRDVLTHAICLRQVDPDATRGAIDYVRGRLAWILGRLERDARRPAAGSPHGR